MDKNKNYYIYMIKFEDGRFYIGSRQSKVHASKDVKYWGSPVTYKHLWEDASLSKTKHILKVCDSFEEMRDMESEFIKDAWKKYPNLCLNRNAAGAIHHDISRKAAPLGGQKSHEMGVGIHALTHEQLSENAKQKFIKNPKLIEVAKETGKKCAELGLGIHAESFKPRRSGISKKIGLKLKEEGKGIFKPREEWSDEWVAKAVETGKKNGDNNVELGRGICNPDLQHKRKEWSSIGGRTSHKKFKFISPQGKIYEGTNYTQWCRDMGFNPDNFCSIITGRQKTTNGGWRLGDVIPLSVFDLGD